MYIKNFVLLFLIYQISFSQNKKQHYLFCETSKTPISFGNVSFLNNDKLVGGSYCDSNGSYSFESNLKFNKIEFSCIGYETKTISQTQNLQDTVFLKNKIINLEEVIISKKHSHELSLMGFLEYKKKFDISGGMGIETSVFIENTHNTPKHIKSFLFKVKRKEKHKTAIRIHFYRKLLDKSEPGEELLNEDIIKYIDEKTTGLIEIDVSSFGLELPIEGAFVGLEWLGILDENSGKFVEGKKSWNDTKIEYNDFVNKPLTFIRNRFKMEVWDNTENLKKEFENYLKIKNYPNASFGIKVYNDK